MNDILSNYRQQITEYQGQKNLVESNLKAESKQLSGLKAKLVRVEEALNTTQIVSQMIQQQAHEKITRVVTSCLQSVFFDEDYGFKIRFDRKRNKTEGTIIITNAGRDVEDPLEAEGGGVLDVAAFVLQLSCLMLTKPPVRRLMILDEPFKFVSAEYQENVRIMVEMLAEDFNVQFITVTHVEELMIGKVVRL